MAASELDESESEEDPFADLEPPAEAGFAAPQVEPVPYDEEDDDEATGIYDMTWGLGDGSMSPLEGLDSGTSTPGSEGYNAAPRPQMPGGLGAPSPFGPPAPLSEESEDDTQMRVPGIALPEGLDVGPDYADAEPTPVDRAKQALGRIAAMPQRTKLMLAGAALTVVVIALGSAVWSGSSRAGVIHLTTSPPDAVVKIDGEVVPGGSSPFVITAVEPGATHVIDVSKAGHTNWSSSVRLQSGENLELPLVTLDPIRQESGFALDSVPRGAWVFVDGEKQPQKTPVQVTDLSPGLHKIRVQKDPDYAPFETDIKVAAGRVLELPTAHLKPRSKASRRDRPERSIASRTRPAPRSVAKARSGSSRRAARASRASRRTAARAPQGAGFLRINTRPWSQVYVDNRLIGNTPQMRIQLGAGRHRVRLVNANFGIQKTISVNIRPGQTVTRILNLSPGG